MSGRSLAASRGSARSRLHWLWPALLSLPACSGGDGKPGVGQRQLEAALEQAGKSGKIVFLEFGAAWCGPCKQLEQTTLADSRVQAWLTAQTVALHIDIDEQPKLATEFQVRNVPSMVFLRPDRTVLGTITGYRDAETFLVEAERRRQGITAVEESAKAVADKPADLQVRSQHFRELVGAGQHEAALEAAEAYWQASRSSMAQQGVRTTVFLGEMHRLAASYGPARRVVERWFHDARAALLERSSGGMAAVAELVALAKLLRRPDVVLEVADELKNKTAVKMLAMLGGDVFLEARRYAVLVDAGVCELKAVKSRLGVTKMSLGMIPERSTETEQLLTERLLDDVARPFEALAGVGREADALEVGKLALGGANEATARERLAQAAERAGKPELARQVRTGH